ncbi:hypothetical protein BGZ61DRAFT_457220 [Ilyonectria robusta]|uniref:uncharacterized protein n=1 Tax=Ilyonectria robusta TaxID=1079257 RepID=UPI001E8DF469|nr:uncharacterized protein BGZ61DRAFT_457220 [Ilyonectria robusta]KAH8679492.1 hypothetical protein BGZ61DRAFT_457220 [Ilyonectria robusta]
MRCSSGRVQTGLGPFVHLPRELLDNILSRLPNSDIKSLRSTCTNLHNIVQLRLSRLFLSPNPLNVAVFRAVANHEEFRRNIVEIIYDDARLAHPAEVKSFWGSDEDHDDDEGNTDIGDISGVPAWYLKEFRDNSSLIAEYGILDVKQPRHIEVAHRFEARLSPVQSYRLYQNLLHEQNQVIATNSDAEALQYGLPRFPNLRKITVTPAAHGCPVRPLYQTPMIRSLPPGLIYHLPRGWPVAEEQENEPFAESWQGDEKSKWRGFSVICRETARFHCENPTAGIFEFVIDTNQLLTGINCRIFDDTDSPEYSDLVTIFSRPGFSRIDLSLLVGGQDEEGWHSFRSGNLKKALQRAPDLQRISLSTNLGTPENLYESASASGEEHFIPLRTIFPIDLWANLHDFSLSRFLVKQDDLMSLMLVLPSTLRAVELSFLYFLRSSGHYQGLLVEMRSKLGWRERAAADRPGIVIYVDDQCPTQGKPICVSREAHDFLYGDGENPFLEDFVDPGIGTSVDTFDPEFERPYDDLVQLMRLGILEKDDWYRRNYM